MLKRPTIGIEMRVGGCGGLRWLLLYLGQLDSLNLLCKTPIDLVDTDVDASIV